MNVPILILAGGSSSRMGPRNKLLEDVHGEPLLRLQARRALEVSGSVTVLIRPDQPDLRDAVRDLPISVLETADAVEGMGGSLRAGLWHLRNAPCVLLMLADLVDLQPNDLRCVITARTDDGAVIWRGATTDGKPGHPILLDQAVFPEFSDLKGDEGGQRILRRYDKQTRLVPLPGERARRDLDTPEDWATWREEQGKP